MPSPTTRAARAHEAADAALVAARYHHREGRDDAARAAADRAAKHAKAASKAADDACGSRSAEAANQHAIAAHQRAKGARLVADLPHLAPIPGFSPG